MSKLYHLSEMCTRINHGIEKHHALVIYEDHPICTQVLQILEREEWIQGYSKEIQPSPVLKIILRYRKKGSLISRIRAYARPEHILHLSVEELQKLRTPLQTLILSTSKGVMSGKEALSLGIGGLLILEVQ
jgi:small subunit ribosomal protein S8